MPKKTIRELEEKLIAIGVSHTKTSKLAAKRFKEHKVTLEILRNIVTAWDGGEDSNISYTDYNEALSRTLKAARERLTQKVM